MAAFRFVSEFLKPETIIFAGIMLVRTLFLYQFKNYREREFLFDGQIICITGKNGSGKTNLLDAIYFLCFTKSYFVHSDAFCVSNEKEGMRIRALFQTKEEHVVQCILRENGKKEFSEDGNIYTQLAKHIGKFPVVIITPDDTQLITEGSEIRRKFTDILISQIDVNYMSSLMKYNKALMQRNALLKKWHEDPQRDHTVLDIYDALLAEYSGPVYHARCKFIAQLKSRTNDIYHYISDDKEDIEIEYQSQLHQHSLKDLLKNNRQKDIITQRSNYGIHKDDLQFKLHNMPLKSVASQGQRKSFLYGLKFAQFEILKEYMPVPPLLLLDDIFEKLDERRGRKLIAYIGMQHTQVFITDTHKERLQSAFEGNDKAVQWIDL